MKRFIIVFLMITGLSIAAFATGTSEKVSTASVQLTAPGTFPIVRTPATIRIMQRQEPEVEDYSTNKFVQWYEQKTNVHVDFDVVPGSNWSEKVNTTLASGNYPDAFDGQNVFTRTQLVVYGSQGVFVPLNKAIEAQGVNIKSLFKSLPYVESSVTAPDGNIYALPHGSSCYHCTMPAKEWIYQPWLDKLGLQAPTTTEEFRKVLEAFKNDDPNGNGKADEIPLSGAKNGWYTQVGPFLMNAFIYTDPGTFIEPMGNGTYRFVADKAEFRDGLRYLHSLYTAGLIDPQAFVQTVGQLTSLAEAKPDARLGTTGAGGNFVFTVNGGASGRYLDYKPLMPLKGPKGVQYAFSTDPPLGIHLVVTAAAKSPELIVRWADFLLSTDGVLDQFYGPEGTGWVKADPGEKRWDGQPAYWKSISGIESTNVTNDVTNHSLPYFWLKKVHEGQYLPPAEGDKDLNWIGFRATAKMEPYRKTPHNSTVYWFGESDAAQWGQLSSTLMDYVNSSFARFVTGDLSLDNDWDTYVRQIKQIGVDKYLEMFKAATAGSK